MSEKKWWEQERAKGYDRYLLQKGLLKTGLPFGIGVTLVKVLSCIFTDQPVEPIWKILVMFGFYVVFFGAFMGALAWRSKEKDYQKPTEDEDVDT